MKQKIIFYLLIFSILINLFLVADYGKRLKYTTDKLAKEQAKTGQLSDSIKVLEKKISTVSLSTE
jgi:hypothetical protein